MITADLSSVIPKEQIDWDYRGNDLLGNNGQVAVHPKTEQEIAGILKYANNYQKTVAIMGGGTKRGFGGTEASADILLSLAEYKGIVEHTLGDMTLTVKSGTPFKELQDFLAKHNQKIPLDPLLPEYSTIGGVIAANDSGPKRLGYGSARDMVIGLKMVYPDGAVIRSGGKTVKNVAGYDMNKLYIGAMGTLGVISEVTLKLRPLPKFEGLVLVPFEDGTLDKLRTFAISLLDSVMEPVALELLNPGLAEKLTGKACYTLAIGFEDVESSVRYQVDFVKKLLPTASRFSVLVQQEAKSFWMDLSNISPNGSESGSGQMLKASVKIGVKNLDVLEVIRKSQLLVDPHNLTVEAHGGLGHGLCKFCLAGAPHDVVAAILTLRKTAEELGGYAIVTHLPLAERRQIEVWGEKPVHHFLLEGIKTKIDQNKILNRGRFVGGI